MKKIDLTVVIPDDISEIKGDHIRAKSFLYDFGRRLRGDLSGENFLSVLDDMVSFMVELNGRMVSETLLRASKEIQEKEINLKNFKDSPDDLIN